MPRGSALFVPGILGAFLRRTIIRRSYPFRGKLIRVRVDEFEQGGRTVTREVVEHGPSVAVIAITRDNDVLLVRQWRHAVNAYVLELPAGLLDDGEESADAARRELREETGFAAGDISPICTMLPSPGFTDEQIALYCAIDCVWEGEPDAGETESLQLVSLDAIPAFFDAAADEIVDGKTFAGLWWLAAHWPFEATG